MRITTIELVASANMPNYWHATLHRAEKVDGQLCMFLYNLTPAEVAAIEAAQRALVARQRREQAARKDGPQ